MKKEKIAGIICEYNPFHNGHAYQIEEIRRRGYGIVVAVMSGNTVQRGEFAITDKYTRAKAALCSGADLVLELPYPYSASSTEFFASAGVRIIDAIGADAICFGSESGEEKKLKRAAEICMSEAFEDRYKEFSKSGRGVASAYFEAYRELTGEDMPSGSNDILGIAYLKAILGEQSALEVEIVQRKGNRYLDSDIEKAETLPSALMIRKEILENGMTSELCALMPEAALDSIKGGEISNAGEYLERAMLSFFRLAEPSRLGSEKISEAGGGLAEKLCKVSHKAQSLDEFRDLAMEGKYTRSRVNRAILHCLTGALDSDVKRFPAYTTVLGFNENGKALLSALRKTSRIPIVTKPADATQLGEDAERQSTLSYKADALYALCFENIRKSSDNITRSPIILS